MKTVLIDDTLIVADIVKVIGEKLNMVDHAEEFSLKLPDKGKQKALKYPN